MIDTTNHGNTVRTIGATFVGLNNSYDIVYSVLVHAQTRKGGGAGIPKTWDYLGKSQNYLYFFGPLPVYLPKMNMPRTPSYSNVI